MEAERLSARDRFGLAAQRTIGRLLAPVWLPATVALMRFWFGWRIEGTAAVRREYRALRRRREGPLLVCANHLTLVDSALVAWALGSPGWFLTHYAALPWNVPERRNFAESIGSRILVYVMKCVPITRGGDRGEVGRVLGRVVHLLERGETVLLFPEGGRSRSGRVEIESAAWGVGRVIAALPRCRVLCVYLRGAHQGGFSDLPRRGERFRVGVDLLQPTSELKGLRRARDLAEQTVRTLAVLEQRHFDDR
ncbi:MAG: lysophospholipid acyltransferase family protein [Candidatus Binatia bacterium]